MSENNSRGTFYITTPIYYPSARLHIGHTYCTVMADAVARFKRLQGFDVRFLTGTDEHGQKIQKKAEEQGVTPKEYVDRIVAGVIDLWKVMEISYDDFIRTTQPRHIKRVQAIFNKMYEKGDIYKSQYEGLYCTPCESFWTESQLVNGRCPDCGGPVEKANEEAYFFRLSKYRDRILDLFESNPDFLQPESRRNEMKAFVMQGLDDLCISRSSFDWGIPVPIDTKHVIYVWLDAVSNYITALGFPDETELYSRYWPADVHLVGKEIVRFHSIIWPAMLMSIEEPLPKQVRGHGWLLFDGEKMSKSKGNVVDPVKLIDRYGVDALKYFLLREYTFGQDGNFTSEAMLRRMNFDLANDLGNLLSRSVSMIEKYCGGVVPEAKETDEIDDELRRMAVSAADRTAAQIDKFCFNMALEEIWTVIRRANKYIDEKMPWVLVRDGSRKKELDTCMNHLAETLRIVSVLIYPFMHTTTEKINEQLGLSGEIIWENAYRFDLAAGAAARRGEALFPRLDIDKELDELQRIKDEAADREENGADAPPDIKPEITFEDFDKIDLRVGTIVEALKHPDADRLLVFKVRMGSETRQIVSGVAKSFAPEELVGRNVIVVANLRPRSFRGMESKGMLLFADGDEKYAIVTTDAESGMHVS